MDRKYAFDWNLLGDLKLGRPNLGPQMRLEVYRLMQFCFATSSRPAMAR